MSLGPGSVRRRPLRSMARPISRARPGPGRAVVLGLVGVVVVVAVLALVVRGGGPSGPGSSGRLAADGRTDARSSTRELATRSPKPLATKRQGAGASTASPRPNRTATPRPTRSPRPTPTPGPTPPASPPPGSAPTTARGFDLRGTVVPMAFPVDPKSDYRYRNNFLEPRDGPPEPYNHVRGVNDDGTLKRAHDGVDLYIPVGTRILSPFDGIVVDPRARWTPWRPQRYGLVVVVMSTEPTSFGYYALHAHLSKLDVSIGQRVKRGQVLGRNGRTGNAEESIPHLHFELRAPFWLRLREAGRSRRIDAFDPYPSLRVADPRSL